MLEILYMPMISLLSMHISLKFWWHGLFWQSSFKLNTKMGNSVNFHWPAIVDVYCFLVNNNGWLFITCFYHLDSFPAIMIITADAAVVKAVKHLLWKKRKFSLNGNYKYT